MKRSPWFLVPFTVGAIAIALLHPGRVALSSEDDGDAKPAMGLRQWILKAGQVCNTPELFAPHAGGRFLSKEAFRLDPGAIVGDLERRLAALPRNGRSDPVPYAGHWWPMKKDGVADRWAGTGVLSPVEKYARAFGRDGNALEWERRNHGSKRNPAPESWWGHCNGWAAAAVSEPEPQKAVVFGGVRFEVGDIKSLLSEVYWDCRAGSVDQRSGVGADDLDEYGRHRDPAFRDVNPGVLHLLAANMLGRKAKAFVCDVNPGKQVWNYPVYSYHTTWKEVSGARAAQLVAGRSLDGYPFNGAAARFAEVSTTLRHVRFAEPGRAPLAEAVAQNRFTAAISLTYVLELDDSGRIIGGEWTGGSKLQHPDFVWLCFGPVDAYTMTPEGRLRRISRALANPYVDYADVRQLLRLSRGETSDEPPTPRPPDRPAPEPPVRPEPESPPARPTPEPPNRPAPGTPLAQADQAGSVASVLISQGQITQAAQVLDQAIQTVQTAQAVQSQSPPGQNPHLQSQLARSRSALQSQRGWVRFLAGDLDKALEDLDRGLEETPRDSGLLARRALVLAARSDPLEFLAALSDAKRAIDCGPDSPWGYCARGWCYMAQGDPDLAEKDFRTALEKEEILFIRFSLWNALRARGIGVSQAQSQAEIHPGRESVGQMLQRQVQGL